MILVQKFGGTSIGSIKSLARVLKFIERAIAAGHKPVVVVSAMSGVTDSLVNTFYSISRSRPCPEYDSILSTGEQISSAIVALSLQARGIKARSFLGWQLPIVTSSNYSCAKVISVGIEAIEQSILQNEVPVISGFQGISNENRISTLGRGGSDTSALAISAALKANVCNIYTDVSGIFSADPNKVSNPVRIDKLSYRQALLMASSGAKVLHPRAIEIAMNHDIEINVLSSFEDNSPMSIINKNNIIEKDSVLSINSIKDAVLIKIQDTESYSSKLNALTDIFKNVNTQSLHIYFDVKGNRSLSILLGKDNYRQIAEQVEEFCEKNTMIFVICENISSVTLTCSSLSSITLFASEAIGHLTDSGIEVTDVISSDLNLSLIINKVDELTAINKLHDKFINVA
ncbi:Aspartokinase [Candidatus Cyrtobacter comes]|uniref:Aspartokinase n=1 Tax=Candidatus Cyrtobacter comes TaxID=675776 RepID=A0ABU5L8D9_9RICK|nr:aspartate kinase [Candidatus Cyrtobacter comes]MDZ5762379.1 Aspartokinase [Candidatus Cyrtobacter comes]